MKAFSPLTFTVILQGFPKRFQTRGFLETRFSDNGVRPCVLIFIAPLVFAGPSLAQKLVDPNSVAPEFRDAAEKRRAEQIRVVECNRKANEAKVLPRDRTAYLNHCLEAAGEK